MSDFEAHVVAEKDEEQEREEAMGEAEANGTVKTTYRSALPEQVVEGTKPERFS